MIAAVNHHDGNIHHFVAGENAAIHRLFNSVFNRRHEFPRNRSAHQLVDEQQAMFLVEAPLAALARNLLGKLVELVGGHVVHVLVP